MPTHHAAFEKLIRSDERARRSWLGPRAVAGVLFAAAGLLSACGDVAGAGSEGELGTQAEAIVNGFATYERPEVALLDVSQQFAGEQGGFCTATMISPVAFVTAAHCVDYSPSSSVGTLMIEKSPSSNRSQLVDHIYTYGSGSGQGDFAIGFLQSPMPASWNFSSGLHYGPYPSSFWTKIGYGCDQRSPNHGWGVKRAVEGTGTRSQVNCKGDSGGPLLAGGMFDFGGIVSVASGYDGNGNDVDALVDPVWIEGMNRRFSTPGRGPGFELGTDRPGWDYQAIENLDAGPCRDRCRANADCHAFTTTFDGGQPNCFLKTAAPSATATRREMVSGIPEGYGNFDLPGGDSVQSSLPSADECEAACARNDWCAAFSYAAGTCWMKDRVPAMVANANVQSAARRRYEVGVDRPGSDLRSLAANTARDCSIACEKEKKCDAFSFTGGRCWLKQGFPSPTPNSAVTSALRGGIEFNSVRSGHVYRSFDLGNEPLRRCQTDCDNDQRCYAWNADLPSDRKIDGNRRCELMDSVGTRSQAAGKTSGRFHTDFF